MLILDEPAAMDRERVNGGSTIRFTLRGDDDLIVTPRHARSPPRRPGLLHRFAQ